MTNFPNLKPYLGRKTSIKLPRPVMKKSKAEIIKEMTEIIVSARKIREEYASSARPNIVV